MGNYLDEFWDGDDSALNGVELRCCSKITSVSARLVEILSRPANGVPDQEGAKYLKQIKSVRGLVHNSGSINSDVISDIARQVQDAADFTDAADSIIDVEQSPLIKLVKEALSAGLDYTQPQTPITLSIPVNVYMNVYAYVGEVTITMSDKSVFKLRGDQVVKSLDILKTESFKVAL